VLVFMIIAQHDRLRGSASTVLTATGEVIQKWRILSHYRI